VDPRSNIVQLSPLYVLHVLLVITRLGVDSMSIMRLGYSC
jgi:hypothetical protein